MEVEEYYIDREMTEERRNAMGEEERIDYVLSIRQGLMVGGMVARASVETLAEIQAKNPLAYDGLRRQIAEEFKLQRERRENPTPPAGWVRIAPQSETEAA